MKKTFLVLLVVFVAIAAFALFANKSSNNNQVDDTNQIDDTNDSVQLQEVNEDNESPNDAVNTEDIESPQSITVTYTDSGYSSATVKISAGDAITFVNDSSNTMWTASNLHPTHTLYPSSDISKCSTALAVELFDTCKGVAPGESWSFTFAQKGNWGYHNHLQIGHGGIIIVE